MSIEINKKEKLQQLKQVANLSTYPSKRFNSFCYDNDDDEDYTVVITPDLLITDSLIMENEHLDTILKTESDEFIKSSVENLVPILSESEDFSDIKSKCDMPDCDDSQTTNFLMFSNPLFDDSTSSDDESSHEEVIHEMSFKTYSNPLFDLDEEIISSVFNRIHNEDLDSTPKNDRFDTKSYLLESLLNRDTLMASSPKIDYLLDEFADELIFLKSIPPGIDEADCKREEDIHFFERLLYDNSSPRPPKVFNSKNSDVIIESFSPSPIPVEDSDPFMEEIDLFLASDGSIPPGINSDDSDSEGDYLFLERLLHDDPIPLSNILDFSNIVRVFLPFFTYPVYDAKVSIRCKLHIRQTIISKLSWDGDRLGMFSRTVLRPWLNIQTMLHYNHLLNFLLQHQRYVEDPTINIPFIFDNDGRTLELGRQDFCLTTGFRFDKISLDPKDKDRSQFRERVFPETPNLNSQLLLDLVKNDVAFNNLDDDDVVRVCLLLALDYVFMVKKLNMYS
nr:phospholipase-like protein [Tanacetum cinerariifolium]